jgi:hypothetical protein
VLACPDALAGPKGLPHVPCGVAEHGAGGWRLLSIGGLCIQARKDNFNHEFDKLVMWVDSLAFYSFNQVT